MIPLTMIIVRENRLRSFFNLPRKNISGISSTFGSWSWVVFINQIPLLMAHELPPPNSGDLHWSRQKRSAECQPTGWQAEFRSLRGNHLVKMCIEGCEKGLWTRLEDPKLALFPAFRGISMLNIQGIQGLMLQNFTLKKVRLPRFISKCSRCKAWSFKIWMFKDWMIDASMVKVEDCWRFKVWRDTCVYIYILII